MTSPRPRLTRDAIIAVAREILAADGLDGLSLRRIGAQLGVTAPALYAHVDDKLDLLRGVAELEFERLIERFDAIEATDPVEQIRRQAAAYVEHARDDPALFHVMFLFRPDWTPQPAAEELPAASKAFARGAAAIDAAMSSGALRNEDPLLVAIAIWAAAHGTASVLLAGIDLGAEYEAQVIDTVIDNLLRGLAVPVPVTPSSSESE